MSSLQDLPTAVQGEIAGLVAASSPQAMEDLRSLRSICKAMRDDCKSTHVGRWLPLRRVLHQALYDDDNFAILHNTLVVRLASDKVGNLEACFLAGLRVVFVDNRDVLQPCLDMLECASKVGHKMVAYVLAICLYRRNSGADDDDKAMRLLRMVEGEDKEAGATDASGGGTRSMPPFKDSKCVRSLLETHRVVETFVRHDDRDWTCSVAKPVLRGRLQCAGVNCGKNAGWYRWEECFFLCSEECRLRHECESFFRKCYW